MRINDIINEEKTRLDPKCWTGKKIGNPKTKMKGGVRVNNCVPIEEQETGNVDDADSWQSQAADAARDAETAKMSQQDAAAGGVAEDGTWGMLEETYHGDEFYEAYGDMWYNEDEQLDEAEYQGRKVQLGKPMQGDVKKFKVYVKDPKTGNVKKVNFGDPNMRIKKSNPARRKSFRARHNCANPGPRTKARYWSCRKW